MSDDKKKSDDERRRELEEWLRQFAVTDGGGVVTRIDRADGKGDRK